MSARGLALAALAAGALAAAASCVKEPPEPEWAPITAPDADATDAVVFLVGDAGEALPGRSPLMARLSADVERWSGALAREGAVNVLYLGDNIYPVGLRTGEPEFIEDSLRLHSQVEVLMGPEARRHRTRGFFMAGNHDWGQMQGYGGLLRLQNEEELLDAYAAQGLATVDLVPEAGDPGPMVVDAGNSVRFVFLDTHWWLQAEEHVLRDTVFVASDSILQGAGERNLLFASHHPFASGGSHGGPMPFWRGLGILFLLRKSGALVQDLNSTIYAELLNGLGALFEEIRQPLIYAGGHDHSLQVIEQFGADTPRWSLVSGSASKLTDVGRVPGLVFGEDRPGYMRLHYRADGAVDLVVVGSTEEHQHCGDDDGEIVDGDASACVAEGAATYQQIFAVQLRGPRPILADTAGVRR